MIRAIYIAAQHKQPLSEVDSVECAAGMGIWGDRHFAKSKCPGQNLTLIESEAIAAFNQTHGQNIGWHATRRNLITQGVRLNELIGKRFKVGEVELIGIELCEPCSLLGKLLENETINRWQAIAAFKYSGGLRADIVTDGTISKSDKLEIL